jgi:hypothetical protein
MEITKPYAIADALTDQLLARIVRYLRMRIPAKGTTAERPSLDASDAGVHYFDTTLAADGKPVWWTGTAWVDSTGTIV